MPFNFRKNVIAKQIFRLRLLYNISGLIYIIENDSGKAGQAGPDDFGVFQKTTILRHFDHIPLAAPFPGAPAAWPMKGDGRTGVDRVLPAPNK